MQRRDGSLIDSYDFVVRQKRCQETFKYPEVYGTKKNAVCGSWTIAPELEKVGADEIWVFLDSRHEGIGYDLIQQVPWRIDRRLCNEWNAKYRSRRTPYEKHDSMKEFHPLGHPHLSAGFHSILYACEFLKPESVTLAGFDNVESGEFTWSITRGPEWDKYPDHRWDIEHEMLDDVREEWDVEINFL